MRIMGLACAGEYPLSYDMRGYRPLALRPPVLLTRIPPHAPPCLVPALRAVKDGVGWGTCLRGARPACSCSTLKAHCFRR